MKYYDLKSNKYIQKNESNKGLIFLYNTILGRIILKIMTSKIISNVYAKYMNSKLSVIKIKKFIRKNNINLNDYDKKEYCSFNDFFIRKIKKEKRNIDDGLIAIADSKLLVYKIDDNSSFKIKNSIYTINELLKDNMITYNGGYALVFRLCVDDYHRYIFPDNGKIVSDKRINGILHTVQPLAFKKYKVFNENTRHITYLNTDTYGRVCYIEVGAMLIGKIVNEKIKTFKKGQEKGHFEFGGSTIMLLFEKDKIKVNKTIIDNSFNGIETIVKMGESIE